MYFYPQSLALNFCVWKSFQRGSLTIHLLFIERASVRDGTIDTQKKIGQDRKEMVMQEGTRRDETAQSSKKKKEANKPKKHASSLFSWCYLDLCSPTSAFKAPQEVTLSALFPGSCTPSPSLYLLRGLHFKLIFHMLPVFGLLLCAYRSAFEGDKGLYVIKTLFVGQEWWGLGVLLPLQPSSAHPRLLDGISFHLLNVCSVMVLASTSETAEKGAVCLFYKCMSINSLLSIN